MRVIYEPKGRAAEYAPLALNIYNGCAFGCVYCYAPSVLRVSPEEFRTNIGPREGIVDKVAQDAEEMATNEDDREILVSFTSDPYQPIDQELKLTRDILRIFVEFKLNFTVLTKAGLRASRDFDLLKISNGRGRFGSTICFDHPNFAINWEPNAASIYERMAAVMAAHISGIRTWISLEPIIDPNSAKSLIRHLHRYVDEWRVGKMNYNDRMDKSFEWGKIRDGIVQELDLHGCSYYIKKDLREWGMKSNETTESGGGE